ncbi:MAG TPA: tetratricopeptide repeat protein [Herpetosiphonaceae bacterium]
MVTLPTGDVLLLSAAADHAEADLTEAETPLATLFRATVAANRGVVFDPGRRQLFAAFKQVEDGLAAAAALQRASLHAGEPLCAALHTGPLVLCGATYAGPTLGRLAAVLAACHPGQVLISRSAQELIGERVPEGLSILPLSRYRLKDLVRPALLFQLGADDLPADFPPPHTIDRYQHNLPIQPAPFIGREREIAELCALLRQDETRLVSLVATSGTGKSRLSLQVAAELLGDFEQGAYFVPLASIEDPLLVPSVIAHTLGIKEVGGQPVLETLVFYLNERRMLLVLDNIEQVVDAAPAIAELLERCPQLKILATTQAPLAVAEERRVDIKPLALPTQGLALEELVRFPSVALFLERAQVVQPAFRLNPRNAAAVVDLCHLLEGLPLAIELVAAHSKTFLPQDMLLLVRTRITLSKTKLGRKIDRKHPVLRPVLDWAYDLLLGVEKTMFARLGVFVGGCTIEAAEAVCNASDDLGLDVLDTIGLLLDKNLLLQELRQEDAAGGEPRFIMLDHIHEYAMERLAALGEVEALRERHAGYYLAMAEEAEPELRGAQQEAWLERLEGEHDNLRAALGWGFAQGDAAPAARICGAIWRFWWQRGHLSEGSRWLALARERSAGLAPEVRAKVLHGQGILAWLQGTYDEARDAFEQCLALRDGLGDAAGSAIILNNLGHLAVIRGDDDAATGLLERALEIQRKLDDRWGSAFSILNLGNVALRQDRLERARELYAESLELRRAIGDSRGIAGANGNLGWIAVRQGRAPQAFEHFGESLRIYNDQSNALGVAECLAGVAAVAALCNDLDRLARLAGASEALGENLKAKLWPDIGPSYQQLLAEIESHRQDPAFAAALTEGRAMLIEQAVSYALETPTDGVETVG